LEINIVIVRYIKLICREGINPSSDGEGGIIAREGEIFTAIIEIGQIEEMWAKRQQPALHS
jgi:hypothetical protein